MDKKSVAALIVTGAMVLGVSGCGTNGATSDNVDNSKPDTSTPVVTEPVDGSTSSNGGVNSATSSPTDESTVEEVEETLGIELPPVEVWYVRDYDTDKNGTISKAEWEKWCADHPEDTNKNMTLKDEQEQQQQQQKPQIPDTSGNPDPGSEQTSKPSTGGNTSGGNTSSGNSGQTSKPSTGGNTSSGGNQSSGGNGGQTTTPTTPPDSGSSGGQTTTPDDDWTEQDQKEWEQTIEENIPGAYYNGHGGLIIPGL